MTLDVIILAAGQGTRMQSSLPKVMHAIAGKPMLRHVVDTAEQLGANNIHVVIGHGAEQVKNGLADSRKLCWALQSEQLGTGHAVLQAMPNVAADSLVLIAYGDVPLVSAATLNRLIAQASADTLALLTVELDDPTGYGRIVRERGRVIAIVEQKDASDEQRRIREVNTGIMAVPAAKLNQWLPALSAANAQGEYYLTDIIAMAVADGMAVVAHHPDHPMEVEGANNRVQLAALERYYQQQQARRLMLAGATLADPDRIDIRGNVSVGQDVFIDVNCIFIGDVTLADNVSIGPNCVIENASIAAGSQIKANSVLEQVVIAERCDVGPFARLRPGTTLANGAKIGNFVETKKAIIGEGSKVNHLSYIGDSEIGKQVNVGAGTITCNYDGVNKSKTVLKDGVFVGSNTSLVAPVTVGENATIGAGSTITTDVAANQLSVARGKQKNIDGWKRPSKKSQ